MLKLPRDLRDFVELLNAHDVRYLIARRDTEPIMPRPSRIAVCVLVAWSWLVGAGPGPAVAGDDHDHGYDFAFAHENVMGTSLELRVQADDAEAARRAEDRVL